MLIDQRLGARRVHYLSPPIDWNMLVPEEITKNVVFVGYLKPDESGGVSPFFVGTAYLVGAPNNKDDEMTLPHLVTARHVAKELEGKHVICRVNDKQGHALNINAGHTLKWYYHPTDETVDAAVAPFTGVSGDQYDYRIMESDLFLTDALIRERQIGSGDEVFMVGLFSDFIGKDRNIPIVRIGNLAMMPTGGERIPIGDGKSLEGNLIEVRSFGGLSGCPVFVRQTVGLALENHQDEPPLARRYMISCGPFWFLGHTSGHLTHELPGIERYPHSKELDELNLGLAIVVPASKIQETINHPELIEMRKEKYLEGEKRKPLKYRQDAVTATAKQLTKPVEGKPIEVPIPTRDQFETDLVKATRRRKP